MSCLELPTICSALQARAHSCLHVLPNTLVTAIPGVAWDTYYNVYQCLLLDGKCEDMFSTQVKIAANHGMMLTSEGENEGNCAFPYTKFPMSETRQRRLTLRETTKHRYEVMNAYKHFLYTHVTLDDQTTVNILGVQRLQF